jgi:hypothetical protein
MLHRTARTLDEEQPWVTKGIAIEALRASLRPPSTDSLAAAPKTPVPVPYAARPQQSIAQDAGLKVGAHSGSFSNSRKPNPYLGSEAGGDNTPTTACTREISAGAIPWLGGRGVPCGSCINVPDPRKCPVNVTEPNPMAIMAATTVNLDKKRRAAKCEIIIAYWSS